MVEHFRFFILFSFSTGHPRTMTLWDVWWWWCGVDSRPTVYEQQRLGWVLRPFFSVVHSQRALWYLIIIMRYGLRESKENIFAYDRKRREDEPLVVVSSSVSTNKKKRGRKGGVFATVIHPSGKTDQLPSVCHIHIQPPSSAGRHLWHYFETPLEWLPILTESPRSKHTWYPWK